MHMSKHIIILALTKWTLERDLNHLNDIKLNRKLADGTTNNCISK